MPGPAGTAPAAGASLAGNWCTSIGGAPVGNTVIQQAGSSVTATVTDTSGGSSQLNGTFDGSVFNFRWGSSRGGSGNGEVKLVAAGTLSGKFTGTEGGRPVNGDLSIMKGACPAPSQVAQTPLPAGPVEIRDCYKTCYDFCIVAAGGSPKDRPQFCAEKHCAEYRGLTYSVPAPPGVHDECYWKSASGQRQRRINACENTGKSRAECERLAQQ
jgi:hypothetical protein